MRRSGWMCEVIEGVHKGQHVIVYNDEQRKEFGSKALCWIIEKNISRKVLIQVKFLNRYGFIN